MRDLSRSLTRTLRLRAPGRLGGPAGLALLVTAENEEHQAQAVEPASDVGIGQPARPLQGHAPTFGTAGDRARQVERSRRGCRAREDEPLRHDSLRLELADQLFQTLDLIRSRRDESL